MYQIVSFSISRNNIINLINDIKCIDISNLNKYFLLLLHLNNELFTIGNNILDYKNNMSFISKEYNEDKIMLRNEFATKDEQGTIITFNDNNIEYIKQLDQLNIKYKEDYQNMLNRKEMLDIWLKSKISINIVKMEFKYFPNQYLPSSIWKYLVIK